MSLNDCVPTSFAEANEYFGGNTTYDEYKKITKYQKDVGVLAPNDPTIYRRELLSEQFNNQPLGAAALNNSQMAHDIKNEGGIIHINMPHSGIRHADNLRSISYYHSGKLDPNNKKWWFYILKGLK